jgi:DNA-binding response OmpR family regulator
MINAKASAASRLQMDEVNAQPVFSMNYSVQEEALHILHVDDDASLLQLSKMILESENKFQIDTAMSVDEAFKKLDTETYDAIISDYDMPQKNGLDFLKELREQKNHIAFIIFTGRGREEIAVRALNLGADRYINKCGAPDAVFCELADAIRKTVERQKAKSLLVESEAK